LLGANVENLFSAGELARKLGARQSRDISDLSHQGVIPEEAFRVIGRRRLFKEKSVPLIQQELAKRGWLKEAGVDNG
jgi:hypothetical protein